MHKSLPHLELLVLRCKDIDATRRFYERLGLVFQREKHGKGPEHYAALVGDIVLELYPIKPGHLSDTVRLGFAVGSLPDVQADVHGEAAVTVLVPAHDVGERRVMLLQDPDGRTVEVSASPV